MIRRVLQPLALLWLVLLLVLGIGASRFERYPDNEISREAPDARPTREHWLGTDSLSRDRFSRLIAGTRVSLFLAPVAAVLATLFAAIVGLLCGLGATWLDGPLMFACELFIALPWLFLLISLRSVLPLNTAPAVSVLITFLLFGGLGWPGPARVVRTAARQLMASDCVLQARASGIAPVRIAVIHISVGLRPVLLAQFWTAIPVFILSEVNLSLIGLGVSDPLPSWGSLLRDFERPELVWTHPEVAAPLLVLVVTLLSAQILFQRRSRTT